MPGRGSVWLSFTVLWAAYAGVFTGYCWLRGYNITFLQIVSPVNWYSGTWPPGESIPTTQVFPSGSST
jgi:hypothetical protein